MTRDRNGNHFQVPNDLSERRIAFILPSVRTGGAEQAIIRFCNHLDFKHKALTSISGGERPASLNDGIIYIPLNRKRALFSPFAIIKTLKGYKPDVVITTIAHLNFLILALKPFLPSGIKIIVRESTAPSRFIENAWMGKTLTRLLYRWLYPRADIVICPSTTIIRDFKALDIPTTNQRVVFNMADEDDLRAKAASHGPPAPMIKHCVHYLCVGRLHYAKGYDRLITALGGFNPGFEWFLTIVGEGPERQKLEGLIEQYGLSNHISLHGGTDNPWHYMAKADALILPSRWEGMPNVALESLALGTPVIATKEAGGITDIADMTDSVTLVDGIDEILQEMAKIAASSKTYAAASLLPPDLTKFGIMKKMQDLVEGLLQTE